MINGYIAQSWSPSFFTRVTRNNVVRRTDAPLSDCKIKKKRNGMCVISVETYRQILVQKDSRTLLYRKGKCIGRKSIYSPIDIADGRINQEDGCLDQRKPTNQLTAIMGVSYGPTQDMVHDDLGHRKFCAPFVPKMQAAHAWLQKQPNSSSSEEINKFSGTISKSNICICS